MDSRDEFQKFLQERAKTADPRRPGRDEIQKTASGRHLVIKRRRGGVPAPKKRWSLPPKVKQYLPYIVIALAILTPLLHNPPRNNTVPPYLVGKWKSSTPGYEDRYLLFVERNLAFGTGGFDGEAFIISEVETSPEGEDVPGNMNNRTLVKIRYMKTDKLEYTLSFYYQEKPVETITFKNQDNLKWTKKGADS